MYKKIILSILMILSLCACSAVKDNGDYGADQKEEYVKAVWISYFELNELIDGSDEEEFRKQIADCFKNLRNKGFNRVTVHTRAFADAFYKSSYFPSSAYCFGTQGVNMPYDPLDIMVDTAHKNKMSIEAWVNPYRVSSSTDFSTLAKSNIALSMKDTEHLIVCDHGIYFNPASAKVKELIVNGIREIVEGYDVDSVCFDDYFYPTADKSIDNGFYNEYKKGGGELSLEDWRRENVSSMVASVYSSIKEIDGDVTFGISPVSDVEKDYNNLYADVEKWVASSGYVDYICPQIYFGFQNENQPFMATVKQWCEMAECDVFVALPLYKAGNKDEFAGDSGVNEFVNNNNVIARQVTYLSKLDDVNGFYIYSFSSLTDNDETKNLYSAMQ